IGAVHRELACFQVISSLHHSVVLGYPWLQKHKPTFDWRSGRDSLVVATVWGPVASVAAFWATFRCGIFQGPSEGFSGSAVASSQWSLVHSALFGIHQLLSVFRNFSHAGQ
ncbi:unnamed protein product, partial [Staurois parvus]